MAYTPELSSRGSATLRRLAWFSKQPMTTTLERLVQLTARHTAQISHGAICTACKDDSKCSICAFNPNENQIYEKAKELIE
jgi:recombinational DNA repair protein RecR